MRDTIRSMTLEELTAALGDMGDPAMALVLAVLLGGRRRLCT